MMQKNKDYYHARFHFSFAPTERGIAGATEKLLQRCNYGGVGTPGPSLSDPEFDLEGKQLNVTLCPMRFFLIPQLFIWLQHQDKLTMKSAELIEANEINRHPYYFVKFDQTDRVVATLQKYMPTTQLSFTFYYHSYQFDEYYAFASAYQNTIREPLFWNRQQALEEIYHRLRERNFQAIDYSTVMIPE